ncbi:MAG: hypothetical protein HUJ55_09080 [Ileibacterium sp.]|nr:hypothetical protein [Ileibacterium sp.]
MNEFTVCHLCPLTREKVINLVKRLQDLSDDFVMKESLLEQLQNGQLFSSQEDFIGNPLLLTILLVSYMHFSEIPSTMSRFYQNAYDALLWQHDRTKGKQFLNDSTNSLCLMVRDGHKIRFSH